MGRRGLTSRARSARLREEGTEEEMQDKDKGLTNARSAARVATATKP